MNNKQIEYGRKRKPYLIRPINPKIKPITGELYIQSINLYKDYTKPLWIYFWVSHTNFTDVAHVIIDKNDKIIFKNDSPPTNNTIHITINNQSIHLEAYQHPLCNKCNDSHYQPRVCMSIYGETKTRTSDSDGWIILGCWEFDKEGQSNLRNAFIELAYHTASFINTTIGTVNCTGVVDLPYPIHTPLEHLLPTSVIQFVNTDTKDVRGLAKYLDYTVSRVHEPLIGTHRGWLPREFFYLNLKKKLRITEDWLMCQLLFAFKLRRIDIYSITKESFVDVNEKPALWEEVVSAIILSVSMFITRMQYQLDQITTSSKSSRNFEQFCDLVFSLGRGDCEDFSWMFLAVLTKLQDRKLNGNKVLDICTLIMDHYIITNCLVQASAPEMRSKAATTTDSCLKCFKTINDEKRQQAHVNCFHMTCIIYPKWAFLQMVCSGLNHELYYQNKHATISFNPKEYYKHNIIPEWTTQIQSMERHFGEGTATLYSRPDHQVLTTSEEDLNMISMMDQNWVEEKDIDLFGCLVNNNYPYASVMYWDVIQIATPFFIDLNSSLIKTTLFLCVYITDPTNTNPTERAFVAPTERYFANENSVVNIAIVPLEPIDHIMKDKEVCIKQGFQQPNPILTINKTRFDKEMELYKDINPPKALIYQGYFSQLSIPPNVNAGRMQTIPYLSYNNTFYNEDEELIPWYVHFLTDNRAYRS